MLIVWVTVTASVLTALAVLASFLPALRATSLGWRVLAASGVPLSMLGVNFIVRFWDPTAGPYRANELYPFGDHLHTWAVSFGFTWLAFGLLFVVLTVSVSREAGRAGWWAALLAGWSICWLPHGIIGLSFAWAGGNAPSVEAYGEWASEPQGFALLLFNALTLLAHFGLGIVGFIMTGIEIRRKGSESAAAAANAAPR